MPGPPRPSRLRAWLEWPETIALAAVTAIGLAFFAPGLAGRWPVVRDWPGFTLPSRHAWREAVLAGRLPQWNPRVGLGVPMTGAPVHGVFYPGHLLLLLGDVVRTLPALFALHATVAGLGAYALARSIRCGRVASTLAAVSWMLGGYALSMWGNGEKVLSGAWVPLAAAGIVLYARAPSARSPRLVLAGGALALVALAGDPFLWLDTLALAVPLAWALVRDESSGTIAVRRVAARAAIVLGIALLLSSPALLPAWLLRDDTQRATDLTAGASEIWSMHPMRLLELVAPGALGDPLHLGRYPGVKLADDASIQVFPWALSLYGGAACATLPFVAGRTRTTWALVFSAVLGFFAAIGRHTPVHAALRAVVFPMRWMRYPEKHALVVVGALALLAALGCDRVLARRVPAWRILVAFAALGVAAVIVAPSDLRSLVASGLVESGIAALAIAVALWLGTIYPRATPLVLVAVVLDTVVAGLPLLPWEHQTLANPPPDVATILAKPSLAPPRLLRPRRGAMDLESLPGNMANLWGIAELPGHDPARSVRLDQLASRIGKGHAAVLARLLRLDWALDPQESAADTSVTWRLFEATHLPRAWIAGDVTVASDDDAYARIAGPDFDPQRSVTIAPSASAHALATSSAGTCNLVKYEADRIALDCDSSGDALVVASEGHADGWTATVDAAPAPIERADVALRGVWVTKGSHRVTFAYATPGLRAGVGLGALGLALCVGVGWIGRRARPVSPKVD